MTNGERHRLIAQFRARVYERAGLILFAHQAEWQLATEGWTLTDTAPTEPDQPYVTLRLEDGALARRRVLPREGGIAHYAADLAAYKAGKSYSAGAWATGFAILPDAKVQFVGLEYGTSEPEYTYLVDFLCSEAGMNMKYDTFQNDKRGGRMRLKLKTGAEFEVMSWTQKEALKGKRIDAYVYCEAYQLPGFECFTSVSQNLRQRGGFAIFPTTPDRPWVAVLHDQGHGSDPDWHCTCGVHGRANPYTFDAKAFARDDPERGGLMTREKFAIAWEGKLGAYIGSVYDYQRGQRLFSPETHPHVWDPARLHQVIQDLPPC